MVCVYEFGSIFGTVPLSICLFVFLLGLYYRYAFNLGSSSGLSNLQLSTWPSSNTYFITADVGSSMAPTTATLVSAISGVVVIALDRSNMLQGQLADARSGTSIAIAHTMMNDRHRKHEADYSA
jgi:hypothetical protein